MGCPWGDSLETASRSEFSLKGQVRLPAPVGEFRRVSERGSQSEILDRENTGSLP